MPEPLKWHMVPGRIEAGVDEAGRGCLAGPVYAAAVVWCGPDEDEATRKVEMPAETMLLVRDSKTLSPKQREVAKAFVENEAWAWGVGVASVEEIERENILKATMLAMRRALDAMVRGQASSESQAFSGGRCRKERNVIPDHRSVNPTIP